MEIPTSISYLKAAVIIVKGESSNLFSGFFVSDKIRID